MQTKDVLNKVKTDYKLISAEFSKTRQKPWPEFKIFLKKLGLEKKSRKIKLLDAGCGNGRLYDFLKNKPIDYIGIDNNKNLLKIAKQKYPLARFCCADVTRLPFPNNSFDAVWCIAVLHHLPKVLHLKAFKEFHRVLKPNGKLMLTVWNLWQRKYKNFIDKKTNIALIPWGQAKKVKRYYYAFKKAKLKNLLKKSGFTLLNPQPSPTSSGVGVRPKRRTTLNPHNLSYIAIA